MALTGDVEVSHLKANVVALKVKTKSTGHSQYLGPFKMAVFDEFQDVFF